MASFATNGMWDSYSAIINLSQQYYNVQQQESILMLANIFMLVGIPFALPGILCGFYSFKYTFIGGIAIGGAGGTIRFIAGQNYSAAICAQIFEGIAQCLLLPLPNLLSILWFEENLVPYAIGICNYSGTFGMAFGLLISALMVEDSHDIKKMNLTWMICSVIPVLPALLFAKEKPSHIKNTLHTSMNKPNICRSIKKLLNNKKYLYCTFFLSFQVSLSFLMIPIIGFFFQNIMPEIIAIYGISYIACGALFGFVSIIIFNQFKHGKRKHKILRLLLGIICCLSGLFYASFGIYGIISKIQNSIFPILLLCGAGAFGAAAMPLGCLLVQEVSSNINEALSLGGVFWFIQPISSIIILLAQKTTYVGILCTGIFIIIFAIPAFYMKKPMVKSIERSDEKNLISIEKKHSEH